MACGNCGAKEIILSPRLCSSCFLSYFEKSVSECIRRFNLFDKKDKICIAVSGGKDSSVLLYLLKKFGYDLTALAIDEGIAGYRDISLDKVKRFTSQLGIDLDIIRFKDIFNLPLDKIVLSTDKRPCHICGVFRRYLLNIHSKKYDKIATGHNLDDECQNIMMNLIKGNTFLLAKLGPKTGVVEKGFTQRVKPLYFLSNKEVRLYAFLKGIMVPSEECPYAGEGLRGHAIRILDDMERNFKGYKKNMINNFISIAPKLKEEFKGREISLCNLCREPSAGDICHTCKLCSEMDIIKD